MVCFCIAFFAYGVGLETNEKGYALMRPLAWRPEMRCTAASLSRRANHLNRVGSPVRFPYFDRLDRPEHVAFADVSGRNLHMAPQRRCQVQDVRSRHAIPSARHPRGTVINASAGCVANSPVVAVDATSTGLLKNVSRLTSSLNS
jgi:hypothetical protein